MLIFYESTLLAFSISPEFIPKDLATKIKVYENSKEAITLSEMISTVTYADLSQKNVGELKELFQTKKEYGSVFGFSDWTVSNQKLLEENSSRILLIEGTYKNNDNKKISFLEIYWADKSRTGQYLLTSESKTLSLKDFKDYINP